MPNPSNQSGVPSFPHSTTWTGYLFPKGDAHLKYFSLINTVFGDFILSPAYDLICTRLHVNDSCFALKDGLSTDEYETESFRANGFYAYDDLYAFAKRIGLQEKRAVKILDIYRKNHKATHELIDPSFISDDFKGKYRRYYLERLQMLNNSFRGRTIRPLGST